MGWRCVRSATSILLLILALGLSVITYVPLGPGVFIEFVLPGLVFVSASLSGALAMRVETSVILP